jgi:hypothetical protein
MPSAFARTALFETGRSRAHRESDDALARGERCGSAKVELASANTGDKGPPDGYGEREVLLRQRRVADGYDLRRARHFDARVGLATCALPPCCADGTRVGHLLSSI